MTMRTAPRNYTPRLQRRIQRQPRPDWRNDPASTSQINFVSSLLTERQTTATYDAASPEQREVLAQAEHAMQSGMTKGQASALIDGLKAIRVRRPETPAAEIANVVHPLGLDLRPLEAFASRSQVRFANPADPDSSLKLRLSFRRNGTVYVDDAAYYGNHQNYGSQRPGQTYRGKVQDALAAILADPRGAALRYSQITGKCAVCNLPLEDDKRVGPDGLTSVGRGIGPVCARKFGWFD